MQTATVLDQFPALIKAAQAGDKEAYGEIYRWYFPKVYRFLIYFTRDKANSEDLCQLTFLRLWKALRTYKVKKGSFQAFLFTIARHLLVDWQRKKKDLPLDTAILVEDTHEAEEAAIRNEEKEYVRRILERLAEPDRELVVLRYFEEYSYRDIAQIVHKQEGAVRVQLHRVLEKMRKEKEG